MANTLHVQTFVLGPWQTNCYVLWVDRSAECWLIDAGFDPDPMIQFVQSRSLKPTRLILTHAHLDHIAGLDICRGVWPQMQVAVHEAEAAFLGDPQLNLSVMIEEPIVAGPADQLLQAGEPLTLGDQSFDVLHTPGHSPGGITLYHAAGGLAIVGDALFAGSVGRTDFPTSDGPVLFQSIRQQLLNLPDATRVLPGHGPETTIGREKQANPFI
jgi:glyoxylase-like metal-dependent hydrolase (beta-lactamase superfamily II)